MRISDWNSDVCSSDLVHWIGKSADEDVEIYTEADESFGVGAGLSAQDDWLIIAVGDNETSEVRMARADDPTGEQILVKPRSKGVEYAVDVRDKELFVLTNDEHINLDRKSTRLNSSH